MISESKKKIDISELNQKAKRMEQLIAESEAAYRNQVKEVAERFAEEFPRHKMILLAGPSSSGKTTTSRILCSELESREIHTVTVSFDDFFKPRAEAPRLPDGSEDLESPLCLDMEHLEHCVNTLFREQKCDFPIYDFKKGHRSDEVNHLQIDNRSALIFEGLHAINPYISGRELFADLAIKVYISIKSEFYFEGKRILDSRELRQIRRIIRDRNFRGCSPFTTLSMWDNVVAGEDRHIRPFRTDSDYWIDSVHWYEPYLYKAHLLQIFEEDEQIKVGYKKTAAKLIKTLEYFDNISVNSIPKDSLLREFMILP